MQHGRVAGAGGRDYIQGRVRAREEDYIEE